MSIKKQADKRIQREKHLRDACEQELMKFRDYCSAQEKEIEMLRSLLQKHGIKDLVESQLPVTGKTIDVIAEVNQVEETDSETKDTGQEMKSV